MKSLQIDKLNIAIYEQKSEMALAAAEHVAAIMTAAIREKGAANVILATGASQDRKSVV